MPPEIPQTEPNTSNTIKRDHTLYGGVPMAFTDNKGNFYGESFWIQKISIDPEIKRVELTDIGYKSIQSFNEGKPAISPSDGGLIKRVYEGVDFDNFVKANRQLVGGMALAGRAHSLAIKDVLNADGDMVSRFAGAGAVIMPEETE